MNLCTSISSNLLLNNSSPAYFTHSLFTHKNHRYIWFSSYRQVLRLGLNLPLLTVLMRKIPEFHSRYTNKSINLRLQNVLTSSRSSKTRFYSNALAFNTLKKRRQLYQSNLYTSTLNTFHLSTIWSVQYVDTLQFYLMLGNSPQNEKLPGKLNVLTSFSGKEPNPYRSSASLNALSLPSNVQNSDKVRKFLRYIRLKNSRLNCLTKTKIKTSYESTVAKKHHLKQAKNDLYQNPYAFLGLKKIPQNAAKNLSQALFREVRGSVIEAFLRNNSAESRLYAATFKDKSKSVSNHLNLRPRGLNKHLLDNERWSLKNFLKSCASGLPEPFPRFILNRNSVSRTSNFVFTGQRFEHLKLPTMLVEKNLSRERITLSWDKSKKTVCNAILPKLGSVLGTTNHGEELHFVTTPNIHNFNKVFKKAVRRLLSARLLWMSYSPTNLSTKRTLLTFSAMLIGVSERLSSLKSKNQDIVIDEHSPDLVLLLECNRHLLSLAIQSRYNNSIASSVLKLLLGKMYRKSITYSPLRNKKPLYNVRKLYDLGPTVSRQVVFSDILKHLRLGKSIKLLRRSKVNFYSRRFLKLDKVQVTRAKTSIPTSTTVIRSSAQSNAASFINSILVHRLSRLNYAHNSRIVGTSCTLRNESICLPSFRPKSLQLQSSTIEYLCNTYLKIPALYTSGFTRSIFFFYNLFSLRNSQISDLISIDDDSHSSFKFTVFPSANDLKISIFRRLNRQKLLSQSRMLTLNSVVGMKSRVPSYEKLIENKTIIKQTPFNIGRYTGVNASSNLNYVTLLGNYKPSGNEATRIRRIRFKPGYNRIWREARTSIREILNIHAKYQYRLTPKLQCRYFQARKNEKKMSTFDLGFALMTTHLSPDIWSNTEFLTNGYVFLNGESHSNPSTKLFVNDFIQLVINLKFYLALRWLRNWSTLKLNKVNRVFYSKFRPSASNRNVKIIRDLPTWFYGLQYTYCDVPKYFEVDYFTLSVFVVHNRLELERWMPTRADLFNYDTLNMYNWKYIT